MLPWFPSSEGLQAMFGWGLVKKGMGLLILLFLVGLTVVLWWRNGALHERIGACESKLEECQHRQGAANEDAQKRESQYEEKIKRLEDYYRNMPQPPAGDSGVRVEPVVPR